MNDATTMNRAWWDKVTPQYTASRFYDVEAFLAGKSTLGWVERDAVADNLAKDGLFYFLDHHPMVFMLEGIDDRGEPRIVHPYINQGFERNGLTVREMREYPSCGYAYLPDMTKADDGYYHRPEGALAVPLLLAFKAGW